MLKSLLIIFLTFTALQADYTYYKILIGSFSKVQNADEQVVFYKKYLEENERYKELKLVNGFDFTVLHGKKYHTVMIRPFLDKRDAKEVLEIVNTLKKGPYVSSYKSKKLFTANKIEMTSPVAVEKKKPEVLEKKEVIKKVKKEPLVKKDPIKQKPKIEKERKIVPKEVKKVEKNIPQQKVTKEIKEPEISKNDSMSIVYDMLNLFPYFIMLTLLIMVFYLYKRNKTLENEVNNLLDESQEYASISKTKDEFLAKMSHEIRTPMNAILGFSHILLETKLDVHQLKHLSNIQNSADILLGIINDILNFSRIDAGTMHLNKLEFNINTVLDNISTKITNAARNKGVELIFDIAKNVPSRMIGDEEKVNDILLNLLNNALKYTDSGEIVLRLKRLESDNSLIVLESKVIDTGIGIKEEECAKLFDSFMQVDNSNSRKYDGMGLGLAIVKEYVNLMDGEISVESTFGKGSCFTFNITLEATEDKDSRSYRLPNKDIMYKKVLVVDNNTSAASSLQRMIAYYHYHADIVETEEEAIEILKEHQYDILCLDSKLIKVSFADTIQHYKEFSNAKIVLLENDVVRMLDSDLKGVDAELQKPFSQQDVFDLIIDLYSDKIEDVKDKNGAPTKDSLKEFRGMTILLAEDNKINQSVIKNLLKDSGILLDIANNGEEAIEHLYQNEDIKMIFMDISMPVMNGYDAAKTIRQDNRFRHIPIVALTANTLPSDIEKSIASGMQEHMGKPFNVPAFYGAIIKYLSKLNKNKSHIIKHTTDITSSTSTEEKEPDKVVEVSKKLDEPVLESMIQSEKGLALVGGDEEMYQELLEEFVSMYKDAPSRLKSMIKNEEYALGQKLSHDIKGVSANLGLIKAFESVKELEMTFKAKNSSDADNKLIIFTHILEKTSKEIMS
jgi:signal transduction histidine kinase/DNA-binding response OmpR family regulator/HPt (histidine-containing phosphotransfer) domain-containing protein